MKLDTLEEELTYVNEEVVTIPEDEKFKKADDMVRNLIDFFS
jgi:hypothetical protein